MSDAEYRLLIQRSFDEELTKQEHRAFVNHLETSDSGQKFHHQLDQMIQAAQDTPLPDDLRPQNPEALARMIMEQLPQKKGSIFGMFTSLFGGGGAQKSGGKKQGKESKGVGKKINLNKGPKKGKEPSFDDDMDGPVEKPRMPGVKFGRKEKAAEAAAEDLENQIGTFSRLKSINTRANDAMENRDAQSTTRSLGEKFGMAPGAINPLDEAPLTLAESIKRKVSESQKLSPLDMEGDDFSQDSSQGGGQGGGFGRPDESDDSWSAPTPVGLPIKQQMAAPVTAQGLDWSGAPAGGTGGSSSDGFEQHPGSAIGLAPPGQKPFQSGSSSPRNTSTGVTSGGGLDWASAPAVPATNQGWGGNAPAMEATSIPAPTAAPLPASTPGQSGQGAPAGEGGGWGSGWGNENQAPAAGSPPQGSGVPLKSSDSWAMPGSEASSSWGQPGEIGGQNQGNSSAAAAAAPAEFPANNSDPWGAPAAPAAAASTSTGGWSSLGGTQSGAQPETGAWGNAASWGAPTTPQGNQSSLEAAPAAANDPWAQPAAGATDPWAASAAAPAPVVPAAASAPAPALPNDPWAAPAAVPAFGEPAQTAAPAAFAPEAPAHDPWAQAAAAPQALAPTPAPVEAGGGWGAGASSAPANDQSMGWGQSAAPAPMQAPAASEAGWGSAPSGGTDDMAVPKASWSQEAEQMETGTWRAFTPKSDPLAPAQPQPQAQAPAAQAAAPAGDRWDQPIQDRKKETSGGEAARWDVPIQSRSTGADLPAPAPITPVASTGIPVNQIVEKMGAVLGGSQAGSDNRWDVPIQERGKAQESPPPGQAPAAPAAPTFTPVASASQPSPAWGETPAAAPTTWGTHPEQPTTTPWGAVTEGAATGSGSAAIGGWDAAPAAPTAPAPFGGAPAWGEPAQAPAAAAQPAWGDASASASAPAPAAPGGWGDIAPASPAPGSVPVSAPAWGDASASPATPAPAAPGGWGDVAAAPAQAAPVSGWGDMAPAAPAQAPAAPDQWAAPPAWGQAAPAAPQPALAAPAAEVTDRGAPGGMFNLGDKDIDKIFGDNLGVSEPVGRTLVNNGADVGAPAQAGNSFAPPVAPQSPQPFTSSGIGAEPAPQPAFAQPAFQAAPAAAAQGDAAKGLFHLTDNDLDKLFSSNLGVDEPSTQVSGQAPAAAPAPAPAPANNFAPPAAPGWSAGAAEQPAAAPAGWGVPAPTPVATAGGAGAAGWSAAPQAPGGWGMENAGGGGGPTGWSSGQPNQGSASGNQPVVEAQPGGWGSPTAPVAPAWNQPAQAPAPAPAPAAGQEQKGGLFSVDDNVMNRIFSDNLGIPEDASKGAPQDNYSQAQDEALPPPKIAGIGRLDAAADQNQDAGSGRIASIGKFLLDQKDLDKIGKLTSSDLLNEGKMRILTLEASQDLQSLLSQIGTQHGVVGSVIVGHDGLLIANTMPGDMDAESLGVWALGVYMNTEHVTKKMGHDRVHQVVSRTPRGYVVIADFGGGLLVTVTDGRDTDSLIPLMRTITQLVN
jgi:predicted regulator of Ras-like GTPase activity (Roadblock/LC7/MglB family)